jgi:hypothetical protein
VTVAATASNPPESPVPPGMRSVRPRDFRIELHNLPPWAHPEVIHWQVQKG